MAALSWKWTGRKKLRFESIETFNVDELYLDEQNYRFARAEDQRACIDAIYKKGADTFLHIMESIAKDNIGELILVYRAHKKTSCIVMDGNRRISALKVLLDPSFAPAERCARHARQLSEIYKNQIPKTVQAQVSDNKAAIMKTVYERHAGSVSGLSRIAWTALAGARFRYEEDLEDRDWKSMALLSQFEETYPDWKPFIDGENYSHDIFRRVIRAALSENVIDSRLFDDSPRRFESLRHPRARQKALQVARFALEQIKGGALTLSRKGRGTYADDSAIKVLLAESGFERKTERTSKALADSIAPSLDSTTTPVAPDTTSFSRPRFNAPRRIEFNKELGDALEAARFTKLSALYSSLAGTNLQQHPILAWVGAWSFFECLGAALNGSVPDRYGHLKSEAAHYAKSVSPSDPRGTKSDINNALDHIKTTGDCNKHSAEAFAVDAGQIAVYFRVLTPFVLWLLHHRRGG